MKLFFSVKKKEASQQKKEKAKKEKTKQARKQGRKREKKKIDRVRSGSEKSS